MKEKNFLLAEQMLLNDKYMYDVLSGVETINDAKEFQCQLTSIFKKTGTVLHEWFSNNQPINQNTATNHVFSNPEKIRTSSIV